MDSRCWCLCLVSGCSGGHVSRNLTLSNLIGYSSIVVPLRGSSRLLDYLSAPFFPTRCCLSGGNVAGRGLVAMRVKGLSTSGAALRNKRNQPSCVVLVRGSENSRIESLAGQHALITNEQFPWSVPEGQRMKRVGKSCRTPRSRIVFGILNKFWRLRERRLVRYVWSATMGLCSGVVEPRKALSASSVVSVLRCTWSYRLV